MIRVAIVDDHAIVRTGLRQFFSEQVDLRVCGEASNGHEALELVRQGEIDVLLMDLSMPDQSGVDALAAIKARAPELPVLILSGFPEEHYATALLKQGAAGYLNKECDPEEIVKAIRTVFRGRKYITAGVAERLAETDWAAMPTSCPMNCCPNASCRSSCGWPAARRSGTWPTACR
jgi:two-component system invasion response regulator UvrY